MIVSVENKTMIETIDETIRERIAYPQNGYTDDLLRQRNLRLKKIGEEAAELVLACADKDKQSIASEAADLIYHLLVAVRAEGVSLADIENVLETRVK